MMPTATFTRTSVLAAIDEVAGRLVEVVIAAPDPKVRVPATPQWTVAEAFGHVATVADRYVQGARQEGEWVRNVGDLAELNRRQLAAMPTAGVKQVAERLWASLAELREVVGGFDDQQPSYMFHGGETVQADVALGILLGELVVHGHDIARALRRRWLIEPGCVELIMVGLTPILPGWLMADRVGDHTGRYEVRLRGQGVHRFAFERGRLRMNPPGAWTPDVVISADPAAFLLVVYKRITPWPAILTAGFAAWGRRPWLAFGFAGRFHQP
jgi:mycothiol maleylpyruvate isomerase-like protein